MQVSSRFENGGETLLVAPQLNFYTIVVSPIRSINYDEKDPFLCNACGFCKYARFDFMLYAKPCCAVDPIENEEDRKKVSGHSV